MRLNAGYYLSLKSCVKGEVVPTWTRSSDQGFKPRIHRSNHEIRHIFKDLGIRKGIDKRARNLMTLFECTAPPLYLGLANGFSGARCSTKPSASLVRAAILRIVVQLCHQFLELGPGLALFHHARSQAVLSSHNCRGTLDQDTVLSASGQATCPFHTDIILLWKLNQILLPEISASPVPHIGLSLCCLDLPAIYMDP